MLSAPKILLTHALSVLCLCLLVVARAETLSEPTGELAGDAVEQAARGGGAPNPSAAPAGIEPAPAQETPVPAPGTEADPQSTVADPAQGEAVEQDAAAEAVPVEEPAAFARDVVLVIDNSGSMKKNDPGFLTRTAITAFVDRLDDLARVALVVFDQEVRMPVGLTALTPESRQQVLASIEEINFTGRLTDSPAAIERALYELKNSGRPDAQKLIVFMTDGIVDTGNAAADVERTKWLREDLAPDAAEADIRIFAIAFTDAADFQLIQSVAQNTKGEYFRALTAEDLSGVFENIGSIIRKPAEPEAVPVPEPVETAPVAAPPPVIVQSPAQPAPSVDQEERVRYLWMIGSAIVLVATLIAIIFLLLRQSRNVRGPDEKYVAEAYLNDAQGVTGQAQYRLGSKPAMIGRVAGRDTDHLDYVVIPQSTIGRRHALIEYKDFGYWIMDQGSINGTFVNDRPVTSETRLKHGDKVRLHKIEFEFLMPEMGDAGKTVLSHTQFTGNEAEADFGEEATLMKGGAAQSARHAEPVEDPQKEEVLFDITGGPGEAQQRGDEEATVVRSGKGKPAAAPAPAADDETLMPARPGPGNINSGSSGDATLLPGTGEGKSEGTDPEDETLLPGSAAPGGNMREGEQSRVPGMGPRRK